MRKLGKRRLWKILCRMSGHDLLMKEVVYEFRYGVEVVRAGLDSVRCMDGRISYRHYDVDKDVVEVVHGCLYEA